MSKPYCTWNTYISSFSGICITMWEASWPHFMWRCQCHIHICSTIDSPVPVCNHVAITTNNITTMKSFTFFLLDLFKLACICLLTYMQMHVTELDWIQECDATNLTSFNRKIKCIYPNNFQTSVFWSQDPSIIVKIIQKSRKNIGKQAKWSII